MSDALRKLIEAVEAGDLSAVNNNLGVMYSGLGNYWPWDWISKVNSAFRGSVDAAIALCETLLPGWQWGRLRGRMFVERDGTAFGAQDINPARALLLAVLRAKLMEDSHD